MFKKLSKLLLIPILLSLTGCDYFHNDNKKEDTPIEEQEFDMSLIEKSKAKNIVKDYVYMYHMDGLKDSSKDRMAFFSDNYQMLINARNGYLIGMRPTDRGEMVDAGKLDPVSIKFEIGSNNTFHEASQENGTGRIIDSGRYFNRYDNPMLSFSGVANQYGRIEYGATRDYIMMNFQMFSLSQITETLRCTLNFENYTLTKVNDRAIQALDKNGDGFIVVKQSLNDIIDFKIENKSLVLTKTVSLEIKKHNGLGVALIPFYKNNSICYDNFLNNENISVTAKLRNGRDLSASYNQNDGVFYVDDSTENYAANSNNYEIVDFQITNLNNSSASPILCFQKTKNMSPTGISPMIFDKNTMEPSGEQVQISKNWHTFQSSNPSQPYYLDQNDPRYLFQGPWLHAYVRLKVEKNGLLNKTYVVALGKWGETYAASHAQLCLIGYSGFQLWDQSALGSWGESITYDPDIGLNRSMIDDVRPFLVTAPTGGNAQFNWSGNVGGADFLRYSDSKGSHNIINQRISYVTQAPNVTNVNYSGNTNDGKIKTSITINMGRTDDVPRAFYTLEYEFLEDVEYTDFAFFKLASDNYSDNDFTKYAYGDSQGIIQEDLNAQSDAMNTKNNAQNSDFFFGLYNSTNPDEYGDTMLCVREFNANVNGKTYDKPGYKLVNTNNWNHKQTACEITFPVECGNVIAKGSKVKTVIEYIIVPNNPSTYYGNSNYLKLTKSLMGTALYLYQQVVGGKIDVKVLNGELVSTYPLNIYANNQKPIEFKVSGGLGYYPLFLDGLETYKGYKLQTKVNGEYVDVDQHISFDNDYYQCYYNELTNKYQFGYNIFNTKGVNFAGEPNYYRLVKGE